MKNKTAANPARMKEVKKQMSNKSDKKRKANFFSIAMAILDSTIKYTIETGNMIANKMF